MGYIPMHPTALIARQSMENAYYPIITGTSKRRTRTRRYVCLVFQGNVKAPGSKPLGSRAELPLSPL